MSTTTITFSPASSTATSQATSPYISASRSPLTLRSPALTPYLHNARSPSISLPPPATSTPPSFTLTPPSPALVGHRLLSENDILTSPLIPPDHKPFILERHHHLHFILTTDTRTGTGFSATGASHADKLVAAEQLARISLVFDWYVAFYKHKGRTWEDSDEECESMATEMLDAGLCTSGWLSTWDQPCFVTPLCLLGKEREIAELANRLLTSFDGAKGRERSFSQARGHGAHIPASGEASGAEKEGEKALIARRRASSSLARRDDVLSADSILKFWQLPLKPSTEVIRTPTNPHARDLKADVQWLELQRPGKGRFRAADDFFHAADMWSALREDLDDKVWTQLSAQGLASPSESLEIDWPPRGSLEGYCLMDKIVCGESCDVMAAARWIHDAASHYFRKALHPWCLRCYRLRRQSRGGSEGLQWSNLFDSLFMLLGILIMLGVEMYIALTDERISREMTILGKFRVACSLFLAPEVQEGIYSTQEVESPITKPRHRSVSCPF